MHLATPAHTSFRAYVSGGARSCIDQVDDSKFMQESGGNFMKGETRDGVESPQNYGFTSVVMDATKGQDGQISDSAEGFVSFMGGNRSFPVMGVMDDRRHRLWGMEKGDTAMYRTKDDGQQFHMTQDGGYWSAQTDKTVRMQLVDKQQQGGSGSGGSTRDTGGGTGGTGGQQQGQQQKGQKPVYKQGQNSYRFVDVTQGATRVSGTESHLMLEDGDSYVHCTSKKTYLGGAASKHSFAKVITESGPAENVYGRIGGGSLVALDIETAGATVRPRVARTRRALMPALMLLLGISLGMNYALITERGPTMLAGLAGR